MHQTSSHFSGPYTRRHDPLQDAPQASNVVVGYVLSGISGAAMAAFAFTLWRFL